MNIKTLVTNPRFYLGVAAFQAVLATLGSLYFSNIQGYEPCILCWWQRIFIYPLAIILPIAFFTRDRAFLKYVTPMLVLGAGISIYHNTIYYISMYERLQPHQIITACTKTGVSCTAVYIEWLGFITIPFLALASFAVMAVSLTLFAKFSDTFSK